MDTRLDRVRELARQLEQLERDTRAAVVERGRLLVELRDEGVPLRVLGEAAGIKHLPSVSRIIKKAGG